MANQLSEEHIYCPYCGEYLSVLIDTQDIAQQYIEDCQVCCRPIVFLITESINGDINVNVCSENDTF